MKYLLRLATQRTFPETTRSGAATFDPNAKPTYTQELLGGLEFEAARSLSLGVRYIHRSIPRVLEDVGTLSMTKENLSADPGDVETTLAFLRDIEQRFLTPNTDASEGRHSLSGVSRRSPGDGAR